jgi:hypothetical protein
MRVLINVGSTLLLVQFSNLFESSDMGHNFEAAFHDSIQSLLGQSQPLHVQIVDISSIPQKADASLVYDRAGRKLAVTDRKALLQAILGVAKYQPVAIGVDIDFSNYDRHKPSSQDDAALFKGLPSDVPITVGVVSSTWVSAAEPLALKNGPSPGWMNLDRRWVGVAPISYQAPDKTSINSFSQSLIEQAEASGTYPRNNGTVGSFLSSLGLVENRIERPMAQGGKAFLRPIDCSTTNEFTPLIFHGDSGHFDVAEEYIRDKIVLLANVKNATDLFTTCQRDPQPGAIIHAAAIESALGRPLYRFSNIGNDYVDVIVAILCFAFVMGVDRIVRRRKKELNEEKVRDRLSLYAAIFVFLLAVLTNLTGIQWLSFGVVMVCAWFHPRLDHYVVQRFEGWRKSVDRVLQKIEQDFSKEEEKE